jgi:ATP-dependent helicase YprA (DUF1998 family)/SOS-response transcriptional repressor LexA
MALNPIAYTERIARSFLRYQLTAYPFADPRLNQQMRRLLSLDETRNSPLMQGPFISLSRSFRRGSSVDQLIDEGVFHPHMRQRIPAAITHVYGHQDDAIRAIHEGRTTLVSTGTGSGKSECFLYPIISKCLELKDQGAAPGISAVIVYPMNALAEDQLGRLRGLLAGTGITFGMYVGKTPERESEVAGIRMPANSSREAYQARLDQVRHERRGETVHPAEEVCSREVMRKAGGQPRILLTNVKQLELLLTRQRDVELFSNARLDFLVFDEAHTFTGANGAETACLIRRLRSYCGRDAQDTVCIATSATIVDQNNPDAARDFAARFFGVERTNIATVNEAYEQDVWAAQRSIPPVPTNASDALQACVQAVDASDPDSAVREAYRRLCGTALPDAPWQEALYTALSGNELLYQLGTELNHPRALGDLPVALRERVGRPVTEEEILAWLTLGAAARREERPLVRPVVHLFVKGISGAVVSFPKEHSGPRLWLAAEDEVAQEDHDEHALFPVSTCTTCGQHYFETTLGDFNFTKKKPEGGTASGTGHYWAVVPRNLGGTRVHLVDHLISDPEDEELQQENRVHALHFCRACGTAHPEPGSRCLECSAVGGLVQLHAIRQNETRVGQLSSCVSCKAAGRMVGSTFREPARPVRATQVADVHVLAQDMVQHAERKRLLIFSDNRQDAAFQAGWMRDHARRFRLRSLMAGGLREGGSSIGDLANHVNDVLERDDALSRMLIPEVWAVQRKEGTGGRHELERRKYLRFQVLREVAMSSRQALGLEPWGRMKVEYQGLDSNLHYNQETAHQLGIPPDEMRDGIAAVLDYLRRKRILWDAEHQLFSRMWMDGDEEIQQGYVPQFGNPEGTKLRKDPSDRDGYVTQWVSERGDTTLKQMAKKWGVAPAQVEEFLKELFAFLIHPERQFLVSATLTGSRGNPLPYVSGVYQVNGDLLRMHAHHGVYQCDTCRRRTPRRTPHMRCPAWRCDGQLGFLREDPDNYNLQLLDQGYDMIRPEEHTAMIPNNQRERLENLFRGESEAVNTLVCTPTLELGVDIGQLDMVLMRNVPPLPANYWQRAGRAGRRHRMAVDVTYCRTASHDRAYFAAPLRLLMGRVDPPAFNLRNEVMVAKHVHATVLTRLHQYTRDPQRSEADRDRVKQLLDRCLPDRVTRYLFEEGGTVRQQLFNFTDLDDLVTRNADDLLSYVLLAFAQGWPASDAMVVTEEALRGHVLGTVAGLRHVVERLRRRLQWALGQMQRLNTVRAEHGALEPEDDALFKRCDALVKRMKGMVQRNRSDAEGYDDVNTFGALAAEGFLPGYGLENGSVLGTAYIPYWKQGAMDIKMPRPPSVALREFVPGNLIYTNGNKFVARRFHRDADELRAETPTFEYSVQRMAVAQVTAAANTAALGANMLPAISVCDVELVHQASISDEEELRFQLGVNVYGMERGHHNGGVAYRWGTQSIQHRRGVRFRLVNVGASIAMQRTQPAYGYPVCTVCGQSVSPLASTEQLRRFSENHQSRCGRPISNVAFYADVTANALVLPGVSDQKTAFSLLESLRIAGTQVLDMHMEDLQVLVIGHVDRDEVNAVLWDPMPGGSGLLDQYLERFPEIHAAALDVVTNCPSVCRSSCIDCLQTFRNGFYHANLDRHLAQEQLQNLGDRVVREHDIPPQHPAGGGQDGAQPVNDAERTFRAMVNRAGFPDGIRGEQIRMENAMGTTTPDVIYRTEDDGPDEGLLVFVDGMSVTLHGNAQRIQVDRAIREWLENHGYQVVVVMANELTDANAMAKYLSRIARYLGDARMRDRLRNDRSWFNGPADDGERPVLEFVLPTGEERYTSAVPFVPLHAAAGAFGDPQYFTREEFQWVRYTGGRRLRPGMFVAQVVGRSMEPAIPDGSYCLFQAPVEGSRQGKNVLVQLLSDTDPETGERYTVKRYTSQRSTNDDGTWSHMSITLHPLNPEFQPIALTADDEGTVAVVAEVVEVL